MNHTHARLATAGKRPKAGVLKLIAALLEKVEHLVEARGEEVERCHDAAVGSEVVLLHDLLVLDRVTDVDVGTKGNARRGWVQVNHVGRLLIHVQVRIESLHERGLATAGHADDNADYGLLPLLAALCRRRGRGLLLLTCTPDITPQPRREIFATCVKWLHQHA